MSGKAVGFPVILTAPSGAGKTTMVPHILDSFSDMKYSVSVTTRKPRKNEVSGKDYQFVPEAEFKKWINEGKFYEYAMVCNNYYGTLKEPLVSNLSAGYKVLLTLDIQGAKAMKSFRPESVTIFILPPSIEELKFRLLNRGDAEKNINDRLKLAEQEMQCLKDFDYAVVNDTVPKAVGKIINIVRAEECRVSRTSPALRDKLDSSEAG